MYSLFRSLTCFINSDIHHRLSSLLSESLVVYMALPIHTRSSRICCIVLPFVLKIPSNPRRYPLFYRCLMKSPVQSIRHPCLSTSYDSSAFPFHNGTRPTDNFEGPNYLYSIGTFTCTSRITAFFTRITGLISIPLSISRAINLPQILSLKVPCHLLNTRHLSSMSFTCGTIYETWVRLDKLEILHNLHSPNGLHKEPEICSTPLRYRTPSILKIHSIFHLHSFAICCY